MSTFFSIHVFTSDASLFQYTKIMDCYPWSNHLEISVLRSIQNCIIGSFWIFVIVRYSNFWLYYSPVLALTVGQCVVMILVMKLFFPRSGIHDQWQRVGKYWPISLALHDTSSNDMMAVPPLWNYPSEVATRLYPVLILLFFHHTSVLLYILYIMVILIQLLFTSEIPTIDITSLIIIFF